VRWIGGIVEREDLHSGGLGPAHLLLRQLDGLARAERLRRYGKQSSDFEFGKERTGERCQVAEMLDHTICARWPKAWGESQCEPL